MIQLCFYLFQVELRTGCFSQNRVIEATQVPLTSWKTPDNGNCMYLYRSKTASVFVLCVSFLFPPSLTETWNTVVSDLTHYHFVQSKCSNLRCIGDVWSHQTECCCTAMFCIARLSKGADNFIIKKYTLRWGLKSERLFYQRNSSEVSGLFFFFISIVFSQNYLHGEISAAVIEDRFWWINPQAKNNAADKF